MFCTPQSGEVSNTNRENAMGAWNYQTGAKPTSWVTGLEYGPAAKSKCAKCKAPNPTAWVSFNYTSGAKGRVVTGHKPVCVGCGEEYAKTMNAKAEAKSAKEPKAKTEKKGRTKKATKPTEEQRIRSPEEEAICTKYPTVNVKPGSWLPSGGRAETHGKKVTVITICPCSEAEGRQVETVRATSDLWQCGSLCPTCTKARARNKADKKKQAKK
jgi:hypothetical protein